jgi:thioredoxin:protein disulfide reductase
MIYGAVLMLGALAGGHSLLRPLEGVTVAGGQPAIEQDGLAFQRVKTVTDLEQALSRAAAEGRPAMLDFYADWCVACIEMEKYTFTDPGVRAALAGTVLLQADVTANDEADQQLLRRFGVFGPPTIIFFGPDGLERNGFEVVGYMQAADFAAHVSRAVSTRAATVQTTKGSSE